MGHQQPDANYVEVITEFRRRNMEHTAFVSTVDRLQPLLLSVLSEATSCVLIGAGVAERELELIVRAMPNIRRLTAIEPNSVFAQQLPGRVNARLPDVQVDVHQAKIQDWTGAISGDVVFLFHMLYYLSPADRLDLYRRLNDNSANTKPTFVLTLSDHDPSEMYDVLRSVAVEGHPDPTVTFPDLQDGLALAGFEFVHSEEYEYVQDVSTEEALHALARTFSVAGFVADHKRMLTSLRQARGDRQMWTFHSWLTVFRRRGCY